MKTLKRNLVLILALCIALSQSICVGAAKKQPTPNSITLNKTTCKMKVGTSIRLKTTVGKKLKGKTILWSSSNSDVATVSAKGNVTAKRKGKTVITAKVKDTNKKAVCKVTVSAQKIVNISMEDAITMGRKEAAKYYDDLQLTQVYSYDNDDIPDINTGSDGKRQWWYVNFANKKDNFVSVIIYNGKILVAEHFDSNGNRGLINMQDISLTSKEAVQKAQKLGLRGGNPKKPEEWVTGYNFKMSYESLVTAPDDVKVFLEVIGISPNGNFAHVDFDAVTGELLLAEEKIEYPNGNAKWRKFATIHCRV